MEVVQLIRKSFSGSTKEINTIFFDDFLDQKSYASYLLLKNTLQLLDKDHLTAFEARMQLINFSRSYLTSKQNENGSLVCSYCGKSNLIIELEGMNVRHFHKATIDHIIPLSKGGDMFNLKNIAIACGTCNCKKGSRSVEEFRKHRT